MNYTAEKQKHTAVRRNHKGKCCVICYAVTAGVLVLPGAVLTGVGHGYPETPAALKYAGYVLFIFALALGAMAPMILCFKWECMYMPSRQEKRDSVCYEVVVEQPNNESDDFNKE